MKIVITSEESEQRLDNYLTNVLNTSRSNISKHIKDGTIKVNNKIVKSGYSLKEGDIIEYELWNETTLVEPENIPLDIYYEDEYIIVVNKPSGMVVHPGNGNVSKTLVNALMYHTKNLSDINGEDRPGIVHRIDKDTSGLLLVSKTNEAHRILSEDFKDKHIKRKYIALVKGYKDSTLIECILETGRTHQIRVHMAYIKHPVINDPVYSKKIINNYGQMLHAFYIGFNHPITKEFLEFSAPLETEFENILETFKNS